VVAILFKNQPRAALLALYFSLSPGQNVGIEKGLHKSKGSQSQNTADALPRENVFKNILSLCILLCTVESIIKQL